MHVTSTRGKDELTQQDIDHVVVWFDDRGITLNINKDGITAKVYDRILSYKFTGDRYSSNGSGTLTVEWVLPPTIDDGPISGKTK
jgi:hypothetical protein